VFLIVLQIYWRYRPPVLLKSSIDFVVQLKEKSKRLSNFVGEAFTLFFVSVGKKFVF